MEKPIRFHVKYQRTANIGHVDLSYLAQVSREKGKTASLWKRITSSRIGRYHDDFVLACWPCWHKNIPVYYTYPCVLHGRLSRCAGFQAKCGAVTIRGNACGVMSR